MQNPCKAKLCKGQGLHLNEPVYFRCKGNYGGVINKVALSSYPFGVRKPLVCKGLALFTFSFFEFLRIRSKALQVREKARTSCAHPFGFTTGRTQLQLQLPRTPSDFAKLPSKVYCTAWVAKPMQNSAPSLSCPSYRQKKLGASSCKATLCTPWDIQRKKVTSSSFESSAKLRFARKTCNCVRRIRRKKM